MKEERAVQTTIFKMIYKTNSYAIAHAPSFILTMKRFILMMKMLLICEIPTLNKQKKNNLS